MAKHDRGHLAYLIKSDPDECERLGIAALSHIPGVWSAGFEPISDAIDYLIAKGTGKWSGGGERSSYAAFKSLSTASMTAYGNDVVTFFDWCESQSIDWHTAETIDLVVAYKSSLDERGNLRPKRRRLAASTINRRVGTALDFLAFCRARYGGGSTSSRLEIASSVRCRKSHSKMRSSDATIVKSTKSKVHPKALRLPTISELNCWLSALREKHGISPYLISKTIVGVGLRAEEALLLRADQLPPIPAAGSTTARMEITFGTKGGRDPQDPDRRGKPRYVRVPITLLKELHGYATGHRKLCLHRYHKDKRADDVPKELFLSRYTGMRYSYSRFYELWTSPRLPFDHFSPHIGRHTWACYTLLEKIKNEIELSVGVDGPLASIATNLHQNLIETWVSTQLGHVDDRTSLMYLNWVMEELDIKSHQNSWWDFLDG